MQDSLIGGLVMVGAVNILLTCAFFVYTGRRMMKEHGLDVRVTGVERGLLDMSGRVTQGLDEMRAVLETFRAVREIEESMPNEVARLAQLMRALDDKLEVVISTETRIESAFKILELQANRLSALEKKVGGR